MDAFAGFEPEVGEIRALRTFRIGPGGWLYPLFGSVAWTADTNTGRCRLSSGSPAGQREPAHTAPEPDCSCGFYGYADPVGAEEYPQSRYVLAVVACWGRVVAGSRGVRAEHSRIEALWLAERVPSELRDEVVARYAGTAVYRDRPAMLEDHPPTRLDCYDDVPTSAQRTARARGRAALAAGALTIGVLPPSWIWAHDNARLAWATEVTFFVVAALLARLAGRDNRSRRRALLCTAMTLWLVAPFAGSAGVLMLRLPILQIAALSWFHRRQLVRQAAQFPAPISN